jgi:hypothetical protein
VILCEAFDFTGVISEYFSSLQLNPFFFKIAPFEVSLRDLETEPQSPCAGVTRELPLSRPFFQFSPEFCDVLAL